MQQEQLDQFDAIELIRKIKANTKAYRRYQVPEVLQMLDEAEEQVGTDLQAPLLSRIVAKNQDHPDLLKNSRIASMERLLTELWTLEEKKKKEARERITSPCPKELLPSERPNLTSVTGGRMVLDKVIDAINRTWRPIGRHLIDTVALFNIICTADVGERMSATDELYDLHDRIRASFLHAHLKKNIQPMNHICIASSVRVLKISWMILGSKEGIEETTT
jgi:hypothetical protein